MSGTTPMSARWNDDVVLFEYIVVAKFEGRNALDLTYYNKLPCNLVNYCISWLEVCLFCSSFMISKLYFYELIRKYYAIRKSTFCFILWTTLKLNYLWGWELLRGFLLEISCILGLCHATKIAFNNDTPRSDNNARFLYNISE